MKVERGYPPNYDEIKKVFPVIETLRDGTPVFTYGDTVYNPMGNEISPDLEAHEGVHVRQQTQESTTPSVWWHYYLHDVDFRVAQEVEAYAAQYNFLKARVNNKVLKHFLFYIASDLSGPLYGSVLSYAQAESKIRTTAKAMLE